MAPWAYLPCLDLWRHESPADGRADRCGAAGTSVNQTTFAAAGARTRVPMLWLYAEEDGYYGATWIRRYHEGFARAGGVATFRLFPALGGDGHRLVGPRRRVAGRGGRVPPRPQPRAPLGGRVRSPATCCRPPPAPRR